MYKRSIYQKTFIDCLLWLSFVIISLIYTFPLMAKTINVPGDFSTIQAAIDTAVNGDTVLVQPGTYVENISFNGKNIIIGSLFLTTQDTSYISLTVIDGNQNGSVMQIFDSGTDTTTIMGLTLKNGTGTSDTQYDPWVGGGAIFTKDANLILSNIVLDQNIISLRYGGGILFYPSSKFLKISNSTIKNCSVPDAGGGMALFSGNFEIENTVIEKSSADFQGGAIYTGGPTLISNSIFRNNYSGALGGAYATDGGTTSIRSSLFYDNVSGNGGGAIWSSHSAFVELNQVTIVENYGTTRGGAIIIGIDGNVSIQNSIIHNNSDQFDSQIYIEATSTTTILSIEYSDIEGGDSSVYYEDGTAFQLDASNISIDPLFVDPQNGDFHLQDWSPAIGAGLDTSIVPISDIEGNLRPDPPGSNPDMGAYENQLALKLGKQLRRNRSFRNLQSPRMLHSVCERLMIDYKN